MQRPYSMQYPMRRDFLLFLCTLLLASCGPPATPAPVNMAAMDIPKPGVTQVISIQPALPTATALPNAQTIDVSVWAPPYLDETLGEALDPSLRGLFVSEAASASIHLAVGEGDLVSRWVFALVTPFPSTLQGVSADELLLRWQGQSAGAAPLLMNANTHEMFSALWGPAGEAGVQVIPEGELLDYAWAHRPSLAIVPFESLDPRWKVLPVDGLSPLHRDFDLASYRLTVPVSLDTDPERAALIRGNFLIPPSNFDPQKMTVVAVTGVTALVRATASTMERRGMLYPAEDIRGWLLEADITHISNEVPFAADCPYPNPTQPDVRFCSGEQTIQLLEDIGTDVVELTGDHFQDWGTQAMFHTLDMYRARGWHYYGGGADLADGRKALLLEHGPNRIAFLGCNAKGGSFAQASATSPGAVPCDLDWMAAEITRLKAEGYLVIATFQHHEYYTYAPQPAQQQDFRQLAAAGADIVSGSQAHQPQGMEFQGRSFIHYGLGNLFFDQYGLCDACELGLIDRHIFYDGRYLSTELLPLRFVDYARSRPMTQAEAEALFETLFSASGW